MYRKFSVVMRMGLIGSVLAAASSPAAFAQFVEPDVAVLYTLTSDEPNDGFGFVGETIGDLNGDGATEIIIGAPRHSAGGPFAGKASIYSGRDGALLHTVTGSAFNRLGAAVAGVGDVDADGVPDYAAGGPGLQSPPAPAPQLGRLLVISGATHATLLDVAGPADGSFFGYDVAGAGDINHDGHADILVGAPFHSAAGQFSGSVHFISGADGSTIRSRAGAALSLFGSAVSRVRDQDCDGEDDHAVGAFGGGKFFTGEAYVLAGDDGAVIKVLKPKRTGVMFGNFFVHDAGDVDADGLGDIFVGDFGDTRFGPASGLGYVFFGGRDDRRLFFPEAAGDGFGPGRGAGDVNGDGHDDLVIAAYTSSAGAPAGGKMFVFSGRNRKVIRTMTGNVPGESLGFDALAVGDVNADGHIDFLLTGQRVAHLILGNP